jgi:hypothetical protein
MSLIEHSSDMSFEFAVSDAFRLLAHAVI